MYRLLPQSSFSILLVGLYALTQCWADEAGSCDENGVCKNEKPKDGSSCGVQYQPFCQTSDDNKGQGFFGLFQSSPAGPSPSYSSIYQHGGSAQAYKPDAPLSSSVCDAKLYKDQPHNVAGWPFSRWSRSKPAPSLSLSINFSLCERSDAEDCCCRPLKRDAPTVTVEAWQTRPDGTYSSLRPGQQEGECRTRAIVDTQSSDVQLETVAPGSYGAIGGLVPSPFFDWSPYGPPSMHLLVSGPGLVPILVDIPMLINSETLERDEFSFLDYRGQSWMKKTVEASTTQSPVTISSWNPYPSENRIDVSIDVVISTSPGGENSTLTADSFCGSMIYGLPSSFFLEPLAVCSSLLDFFPL